MAKKKDTEQEITSLYCYLVTASAGAYPREWLADIDSIEMELEKHNRGMTFRELHTNRPVLVHGNFFVEALSQKEYHEITQVGLFDRICKECDS